MGKPKQPPCKHCGVGYRNGGNGLCKRCRHDADVCRLYGLTLPPSENPTEEELNAMIAERMKDLPPWWRKEAKEELAEKVQVQLVHLCSKKRPKLPE